MTWRDAASMPLAPGLWRPPTGGRWSRPLGRGRRHTACHGCGLWHVLMATRVSVSQGTGELGHRRTSRWVRDSRNAVADPRSSSPGRLTEVWSSKPEHGSAREVSLPPEVKLLQEVTPPFFPEGGSGMTILVDWPPGRPGLPPHRHSGPSFGYVMEGALRFELEGEPERVVEAGGTFWEPGGDVIHYQDGNALSERTDQVRGDYGVRAGSADAHAGRRGGAQGTGAPARPASLRRLTREIDEGGRSGRRVRTPTVRASQCVLGGLVPAAVQRSAPAIPSCGPRSPA